MGPVLQRSTDWLPWETEANYRYRRGSRYAGDYSWERYLQLQLTTTEASLHFTSIHYGSVRGPNVLLTSHNPAAEVKLYCGLAAAWGWDVTAHPIILGN
jgi:hypothetical protein